MQFETKWPFDNMCQSSKHLTFSLRYLKSIAGNGTRSLVAVLHVVDVAQKLELIIHGGDDGVETVSDQSDLFVEFGITGQGISGNSGEFGEVLLGAGSLLEEPVHRNKMKQLVTCLQYKIRGNIILDEDGGDHGVAATPDIFPAPLDISDLVGSQFSLGISQIFGLPNVSK